MMQLPSLGCWMTEKGDQFFYEDPGKVSNDQGWNNTYNHIDSSDSNRLELLHGTAQMSPCVGMSVAISDGLVHNPESWAGALLESSI